MLTVDSNTSSFLIGSDSFSIRIMGRDDVIDVLRIEKDVQMHPWNEGHFKNCLQTGNFALVIEKNSSSGDGRQLSNSSALSNSVVAFAVVSVGGGESELLNIAVDPKCRRIGVAHRLISCIVASVSRSADNLFLEVRESNASAISLYENLGFNQVGRRRNYYPSNDIKRGPREDAFIYALVLDPSMDLG